MELIYPSCSEEPAEPTGPDPLLSCLAILAQYHQVVVDVGLLQHQFGREDGSECDSNDVLRAAKAVGLRAKLTDVSVDKITSLPLPVIALGKDQKPFIIARIKNSDDSELIEALISDPTEQAPKAVAASSLVERFSGTVILVSKRLSLRDSLQQKFDIRWFIPSLIKYKKHFGEVVVAAFFLQLFALITPLFFQVVMDKVLVHQGFTTL